VRAAQYYWHMRDVKAAQSHLDRAKTLDPQDPLLLGISLSQAIREGRLEDVIRIQKQLVAADPLSATSRGNLGIFLMMAGELAEAQRELERSLELSPALMNTVASIAKVLVLQGRNDEALTVAARMPAGYQRDRCLALIHFARGDVNEGEMMLQSLRVRAEQPDSNFDISVAIAEVYASRQDSNRAFTWLDMARRRAESQHGEMAPWVLNDDLQVTPFLKPLHSDPRWQGLQPPQEK
jgi:Flp pilus assembly protein TadD